MKDIRAKVETVFVRLTGWIYRNRFKTLFLMLMLIGYLGSHISNISIDTSTEEMLHKTDPSRIEYNNFKDQFGNSEYSIIMIERNAFTNHGGKLSSNSKNCLKYDGLSEDEVNVRLAEHREVVRKSKETGKPNSTTIERCKNFIASE